MAYVQVFDEIAVQKYSARIQMPMQVQIQFNRVFSQKRLDTLVEMEHFGLLLKSRVIVKPIQILAISAVAEVTVGDSIRVDHGNDHDREIRKKFQKLLN